MDDNSQPPELKWPLNAEDLLERSLKTNTGLIVILERRRAELTEMRAELGKARWDKRWAECTLCVILVVHLAFALVEACG